MECNPTKRKHLTNHRSSTKDIAVTIEVPRSTRLRHNPEARSSRSFSVRHSPAFPETLS
jgi:hypothetical protein